MKAWSNVVNDGFHNDKVRRDALIALAFVLIAVVVIVVAVTGALGPLTRVAVGNIIVRVAVGSVVGGGGLVWAGLQLRCRRTRHAGDGQRQ